jgi:hypothetical protein
VYQREKGSGVSWVSIFHDQFDSLISYPGGKVARFLRPFADPLWANQNW